MTRKLPITQEGFAAGIDRLIERATKVVAKYPRTRAPKSKHPRLARTA